MRTTLKQIANETHLSVAIVSQVLNNKECRVSEENRKLIIQTARILHYRPNRAAVSLVTGVTKTIGLIVSDIRNDFFGKIACGVENECQKNNWQMMLCSSHDQNTGDLSSLRMMMDNGVSGIILDMASDSTPESAEKFIRIALEENVKIVMIDRYFEGDGRRIVCMDHTTGGYLATEYLIRKGHRRIACIGGPRNLIDAGQRMEGYRRALQFYKIPQDPDLVVYGCYTYESGIAAARQLIERNVKADSLFAFNDMMAIGAMTQLRESGFRIPEDISVVGYDDIFLDRFLEIPLTTIHQPAEEMGKAAANIIISEAEGSDPENGRVTFHPTLIERQSVCCSLS